MAALHRATCTNAQMSEGHAVMAPHSEPLGPYQQHQLPQESTKYTKADGTRFMDSIFSTVCLSLSFLFFFFLNTLPFINKPIARRPGHTHSAMFLSPSYRSAAGCHRNGLIVAKWGMLMQSSILPSAVGFLCPSHSAVCTVVHLCLYVHVTHNVAFTATSLDYHCLFYP